MDLHKAFSDNWGIKLISLVFAITLWFYVTATGKTEISLTVPLELRNVPQGMTVVGNVTSVVEIRVQGQERVLGDNTFGEKVACILDLSMTKEGENIVRISPDDIKRPDGVMVTHMSLSEVKVKLERLVRRSFRLRPRLFGRPAAGYRVAGVTFSPAKIVVEGPASVMERLRHLDTMPIDIQGAKDDLTASPKIDYQGQPVKLLKNDIMVRIDIARERK
jgi:YbbR domain-containing protein